MLTSRNKPLADEGIHLTTQLFDGDDSLLEFGFDQDTKLPLVVIRMKSFEGRDGGAMHCPFLRWDDEELPDGDREILRGGKLPREVFIWTKDDARSRFYCGLGTDRPTQCDLYPVGRMIDNRGRYRTSVSIDVCRKCMPQNIKANEQPTAEEYAVDAGKRADLRISADYLDTMEEVGKRVTSIQGREYVGKMLFNFDSVLLEAGFPMEDVMNMRPLDPMDLHHAVRKFIDEQDRLAAQPEVDQR